MRIAGSIVALVLSVGALWAPPAGAIETTTFGIDAVTASAPADGEPRLVIGGRPGSSVTAEVQVWNRGDAPVTLSLSVEPVTVDASGSATLGGDSAPVGWVELSQRSVRLEPGASARVPVRVRLPRDAGDERRTVAVVAQPAPTPGEPQGAVLQRLALVAHLRPAGEPVSPGGWPWQALLAAGLVTAAAAGTVANRRRLAVRPTS